MFKESEFFNYIREIDKIIAGSPSSEHAVRLKELAANPQLGRYIFTNLKRTDWLEPLTTAGLFTYVPSTANSQDAYWYPVDYLVASSKEKPEAVFSTIKPLLDSENPYIRVGLLKAGESFSNEALSEICSHFIKWMEVDAISRFHFIKDAAIGLIKELVRRRLKDEALRVTKTLLRVRSKETALKVDDYVMKDAVSVLDSWDYKNLLEKDIRVIFEAYPLDVLNLIFDALSVAIECRTNGGPPEDYSTIWCKDIGQVSRSSPNDVEENLVAASRDYSQEFISKTPSRAEEVFALLSNKPWYIFTRLKLYILSTVHSLRADLTDSELRNVAHFDDYQLEKEYLQLLKVAQTKIDAELLKTLLDLVEKGPDNLFDDPSNPTDEEKKYAPIRMARWSLEKLEALRLVLPPEWKEKVSEFEKIIREYETEHPPHPDGVWHGPNSSFSAEDLERLNDTELFAVLEKEPKKAKARWLASPEGLSRVLGEVIRKNPNRVEFIRQLPKADLIYVHGAFMGLREGVAKIEPPTWPVILELLLTIKEHVASTSAEPTPEGSDDDDRVDRSQIKKAVSWFLNAALHAPQATELYSTYADKTWEIIEWLTSDPDPTPEYESKYLTSAYDAYTAAINSVRGEGLNCLIQFSLKKFGLEKKSGQIAALDLKVRNVLSFHADSTLDPSLAVRAIYGALLPWLVLIDKKWVSENLNILFPNSPENKKFRLAVWSSYLLRCQVYDDAFAMLEAQYAQAVSEVEELNDDNVKFVEKLVEHLMVLYWRGKVSLEKGLLKDFYEKAPLKLRKFAFSFLGRSIKNTNGDMPAKIKVLFMKIFDVRFAAAKSLSEMDELSPFGWWFTSDHFDAGWRLASLRRLLDEGVVVDPDFDMIKTLQGLEKDYSADVLYCLEKLVDQVERIGLYTDREVIREMLKFYINEPTLASMKPNAVVIANKMGSKGFLEFKELL